MNNEYLLDSMIQIELANEDNFLKIKETLDRIGVSSTNDGENKLYPSVVILHKRGKYYLSHFKYLFGLDGKTANISGIDIARMRTIAQLIRSWGLCSFTNDSDIVKCESAFNPKLVKIVPYKEKQLWTIVKKYSIGTK